MKPLHVLLAILVMAMWGFNFVPIKVSVMAVPPIFVIAVRFTLVALLLLPFISLKREHLARAVVPALSMGVVHFSLTFTGLRYIDAGTAAILLELEVPLMVLLGAVFLKERFGWRTLLGILLAFLGAIVIAGEPRIRGEPIGFALMIAAAVTWAAANVQIKTVQGMPPLTLTALLSGFAAPPLFLLSFLIEDHQIERLVAADWPVYASFVYMIVLASIVSYGLWFYLLGHHPVYRVASFVPLVPVFAVLGGVFVLEEPFGLLQIIGGGLTVAGVAIVVWRRARRLAPAAVPHE